MTHPRPVGYPVRLAAARATLADLDRQVGEAGLAAAARHPGLLADVDQHAAALRELLGDAGQAPSPIGLAGYADGLRDMAGDLGWRLPGPETVDWARAPWLVVRLLAICQLATTTPAGRRPTP